MHCHKTLILSLFLGGCFTGQNVEPRRQTGAIAGCVHDSQTHNVIQGAIVDIKELKLGSVTENNGKFLILNLSPGSYDVRAMEPGHHRSLTTNVTVSPDSVTILSFGMTALGIPEEPLPREWKQMSKLMSPYERFLANGGIYSFQCDQ